MQLHLVGVTAIAMLGIACDETDGDPLDMTSGQSGSTIGSTAGTSNAETSATSGDPESSSSVTTDTGSGGSSSSESDRVSTSSSGDQSTESSSSESGNLLPEFGMIGGRCGDLGATRLDSPSPAIFENAIDFGTVGYDPQTVSAGGQMILDRGNLGGSSVLSELVSYEVLRACEGAVLLATEGHIDYDPKTSVKTDLLVEVADRRVGVSVTRAFGFPPEDPYTVAQARQLLEDKLGDILESSANVVLDQAWAKQILHVIAYEPMHAQSVRNAFDDLDPDLVADTIVVVTVTHGDDMFIY